MKRIINHIKEICNNFLVINKLINATNKDVWAEAEMHLTEYNKSIISLSSSALILSFSVIKLGKLSPNKTILGISWVLFLLVIGLGLFIQLFSFLYHLSSGNIERLKKYKEWKTEMMWKNPEVAFFWSARSWMTRLSVIELLFFFLALSCLIIIAFSSV